MEHGDGVHVPFWLSYTFLFILLLSHWDRSIINKQHMAKTEKGHGNGAFDFVFCIILIKALHE